MEWSEGYRMREQKKVGGEKSFIWFFGCRQLSIGSILWGQINCTREQEGKN